MSLLLLPIFLGTCARCWTGGEQRSIRGDSMSTAKASRRSNREVQFIRARFGDAFNGVMLIDAPQTDYDAGGVYFFGSSNVVFAAQFANLPEQQQKLIHDFGFPGANPTQIFQFIRYLEQQHGFLKRGAAKTHVAICLTENDLIEEPAAMWFLPSALRDTGMFTYDRSEGFGLVPMSKWERAHPVARLRLVQLHAADSSVRRHGSRRRAGMWRPFVAR